jgi:flagellar basal-body rod protein FlgB
VFERWGQALRDIEKTMSLAILDRLFSPHMEHVQAALGRASERHRLLAGNLANVNTPGYKRRDLDLALPMQVFADQLAPIGPVMRGPTRGNRMVRESRSIRADGNSVDLEREVAAMVETQLHYQALSLVSRRYFQGLKDVIREGR